MICYFRIILFVIGMALPWGMPATEEAPHVRAELLSEETTIQPGSSFWVALHLTIEDNWHVYWKNPGDAGLPLKLTWTLPEGFQAGPLQWPFPEKFTIEEMVGFGYHKEVTLLTHMIASKTLTPGTQIALQGEVKWLVCSSMNCEPGSAPVNLTLNVDSAVTQKNEAAKEIFAKARSKMPKLQVQVKTIHKEGVVQLQVPVADSTGSLSGVYFFPEHQNVIDSTVDPIIAVKQEPASNGYLVHLKGGEEIGVKNKNLRGVLVVETETEGVKAYDIDSPIQDDTDKEFLSLIDIKDESSGYKLSSIGSSAVAANVQNFEGGLGLALLFAFLGGMILNLMPCVLPVVSFKVMSFVKMAGQSRLMTMKHGIVFSLGVLISFWVLAIVMLILRTYGQAVGWGFQLQEPLFVIILASILFVFALSLFGLFEWGLVMASWAGQTEAEKVKKTSGYTASFLSGVMATAVATPCTGPFLGSAVGFAVTLPVFQSLLIFTSLGIGMCFPYLVLAAFPAFLRFVPRPGPWMETFKQLMAFMLLATVLWLMWVFSAQTNTLSLICLLAGFLCFSFAAWVYGRGCSPVKTKIKRVFAYAVVALMVIAGCRIILLPRATWYDDSTIAMASPGEAWSGWEPFSPERIDNLQKLGTPVIVDFTAKWCLICQANHLVLDSKDVCQKLDVDGVVKMKADWTKSDPVITEALSKFGRNSVPLYVLYTGDPEQEPIILPQVLTSDVVLEHLEKLNEEVALK